MGEAVAAGMGVEEIIWLMYCTRAEESGDCILQPDRTKIPQQCKPTQINTSGPRVVVFLQFNLSI